MESEEAYLEKIGQRIAAGRIAHGDSQEDLACRLGVSRHTVASMEKGSPATKLGLLLKAAGILGCLSSFDNLMERPVDPFKAYDERQHAVKKKRVRKKKA